MYSYSYMLLLCFLYIQNTYAYVAYYMQNRSGMSKYEIDDYIPEWNKKCFTQDIYRNILCSVSTMVDNCILYVNCVSNYCSANVIQLYQHYAKYNDLSGVIFHGNPAFEGECVMPSAFIQQDLSSYVKHNIVVEFGYVDETKSTFIISEIHKYSIIVFMTIFAFGLIIKFRYSSQNNSRNTWSWHRSPLPNFNSINVGDNNNTNLNENEEDNDNSQIRILVNTSYVASDSEPPTCAICLDSFENGDTISKLSCEHEFKHECINEWLKKNPRCPLCNSQE